MSELETYIFPLNNPSGWGVESIAGYKQLMYHIISASAELQEEYPDKHILVTFLAEPEGV